MVNYLTKRLDATFSALADPTRRAIVQRLAEGSATIKELARPFHVSLPAISKHLRVLENAGLLKRRKQGRTHHCRLNTDRLEEAGKWIERYRTFWEQRFDALDTYLQSSHQSSTRKEKSR